MVAVERTGFKNIGAFGMVILLCCAILTDGRAAGPGQPQQLPIDPNPAVNCPDASVLDIGKLNLGAVDALKHGILGLPCDAVQEAPKIPVDERKLQHGFDYYSWLTFIALNSPKGGGLIGDNTRPAWEDFKQLPDVMLPGGAPPDDWSDENSPLVPAQCVDKFKPGMMIVHMEMEETYNEPFKTGPLFDQNGNYALFVIFMNQQMFQYIKNNNLYSRVGQEEFPTDIDFPNGSDGSGKTHPEKTLGAIMIKASWKLMKEGTDFGPNAPPPKYHMIDALLYRPRSADSCRQVKLGLIGFHVGHKTVSRQQWIWTTFEHRDNVPTEQEVKVGIHEGKTYSFYDSGCKVSECPVNQTPKGSWDPDILGWVPFQNPSKFKSQIVRTGIASPSFAFDHLEMLNSAFHNWPQIKGTVWDNYDLITTQWPSAFPCATIARPGGLPDATCAPFPTFLANSTLETFSQPQQETETRVDKDAGVPLATSSCISCHNNATTQHRPATRSDFTYILEKAK